MHAQQHDHGNPELITTTGNPKFLINTTIIVFLSVLGSVVPVTTIL
jgi:hypothetical protein